MSARRKTWRILVRLLVAVLALAVAVGGLSLFEHRFILPRDPIVVDHGRWLGRSLEDVSQELIAHGYSVGSKAQHQGSFDYNVRNAENMSLLVEKTDGLRLFVSSKTTSPVWWPFYYVYSTAYLLVDDDEVVVGFWSTRSTLPR